MTAKILIKRTVPEANSAELSVLLNKLRALTMVQPGYVSGETLKRVDKTGECLVISTWVSTEHWREWANSHERYVIQKEIDQLLSEKTRYEIYTY